MPTLRLVLMTALVWSCALSDRPQDSQPQSAVPKEFKPKTDVSLTPTEIEAVQASETWRETKSAPSPGPDGRVLYTFGAGLPTIVCAPLRVCIVELQTGEKIVGEPHIGDSVRWNISPALYLRRWRTIDSDHHSQAAGSWPRHEPVDHD